MTDIKALDPLQITIKSQRCPGLARLSAEDKTKLEQLAKEETEQELAAKVAGADQR